jgi:hypothetical protein
MVLTAIGGTLQDLTRRSGWRHRRPSETISAENRGVRTATEWSGHASLAIGPTTAGFRSALPVLQRKRPTELTAGLVGGWLQLSPTGLVWYAVRKSGPTPAAVIATADITAVELVKLRKRKAGLTVTTTGAEELWLLVEDRRKLDNVLGAVRYGS